MIEFCFKQFEKIVSLIYFYDIVEKPNLLLKLLTFFRYDSTQIEQYCYSTAIVSQ